MAPRKYKTPEKSNGRSQPELLVDFVEGVRQASSAAGVLGNVLRNPEFWKIADVLHTVKTIAPNIAVTSLRWAEPEMKTYVGTGKAAMPKTPLITDSNAPTNPTKVIT